MRTKVEVTQERRSDVKTDEAGVVKLATIVLRPQTAHVSRYGRLFWGEVSCLLAVPRKRSPF